MGISGTRNCECLHRVLFDESVCSNTINAEAITCWFANLSWSEQITRKSKVIVPLRVSTNIIPHKSIWYLVGYGGGGGGDVTNR